MSFIFGRKKGPTELVKSVQKHIALLQSLPADDEKSLKKSLEKISLNLSNMKFMLYGDAENEPKDTDIAKLCDELFATNALIDLLVHMKEFEFEARKDVARVYDFVLRQRKQQSVEYVKTHADILKVLVEGYNDSEIALNCGQILREVIRHEELNELLLHSPQLFDAFFEYVQLSTFDIASDAFATFKLMLTKHKVQCAKFLDTNFDTFVVKYNVLLQSRNYVTKRQSLKLLGELLLNRSNFTIMMRYINNADNLKIMMNMLRGNCFPLDHQVLTSAGWVYLDGAKQLAAAGRLEAACWIDGHLEYHAATVVEKPAKKRVLVSIGGPATHTDVDLCCTENHRVFGRLGKGIASSIQWSRRGHDAIVPPLDVHQAGGLLRQPPHTVLQLMTYAEHGLAASGEPLPFVAALGLTKEGEIDAFLVLYGYWLGDGWLDDGKICFGPVKDYDMWLENLFRRLPLEERSSATIGQSGYWRAAELSAKGQRYYYITEPAWVQYFWAEYGHKYAAPLYATYLTTRTVLGDISNTASSSSSSTTTTTITTTTSTTTTASDPEPLEDEGIKSAKWFWWWVYCRLGVYRLRLVLAGLRCADGDEATDLNRIYTSSPRFRDEISRVALHAGYSVLMSIEYRVDDVNGKNAQGRDIIARNIGYAVSYTTDMRFTQPKMKVNDWVTSAKETGVVWCVTVPEHTGQLILVRRVREVEGDTVVDASRPLVVGNTKAIQFEAFHVFKIFVANPKKSQGVIDILIRNKRKLIEFLMKFQKEKEDDQFNEEKNTLLATLGGLPDAQVEVEGGEEEKKEE